MAPHELLLVIDELEDERSRLRRREGIWVSVLAHILLFLLIAFLPRFLPPQVHVRDAGDALNEKRDTTILTLPPNALKALRPAPRPAGGSPPPAAPAPSKALEAAPAPKAPAPQRQQAQQQQPPPLIQPQPSQQAPVLPLPATPQRQAQAPTKPSFSTGTPDPGQALRDAARAAARANGTQLGDGNLPGAPGSGKGAALAGGAEVLSDTGGWDYGPYIRRVVYVTKQTWYPIIPEEVRPPLLKKGVVGIRFKIMRDGSVGAGSMILEAPSHDVALDKAAWGAINGSSPYPPLPPEFKGPYLELRFGFYYNLEPGVQ